MNWTSSEDIGIALYEKFAEVDPLTVRFTDLREKVLGLDGFDDDPHASNEAKLEAIQMAWYEEWLQNKSEPLKRKIIEYNLDDVRAMEVIDQELRKLYAR